MKSQRSNPEVIARSQQMSMKAYSLQAFLVQSFYLLGVFGLVFSLIACEENPKHTGTTTTAENGIHGVARQKDGSFARKGSEVQLKKEEQDEDTPKYLEVADTVVNDEGEFFLAPPDTGVFVIEVEQKISENNQSQSYIDRQTIRIESLDKAYTLDTLVLELVVTKRVKLFFESRKDLIEKAWVGQAGSDRLTVVGDDTWIDIIDYDPEETELILFYRQPDSDSLYSEYLWGIEPEDEEIYIADFFEDNYKPTLDGIQECEDECEWDADLELQKCLDDGNDEDYCDEQVNVMLAEYHNFLDSLKQSRSTESSLSI